MKLLTAECSKSTNLLPIQVIMIWNVGASFKVELIPCSCHFNEIMSSFNHNGIVALLTTQKQNTFKPDVSFIALAVIWMLHLWWQFIYSFSRSSKDGIYSTFITLKYMLSFNSNRTFFRFFCIQEMILFNNFSCFFFTFYFYSRSSVFISFCYFLSSSREGNRMCCDANVWPILNRIELEW